MGSTIDILMAGEAEEVAFLWHEQVEAAFRRRAIHDGRNYAPAPLHAPFPARVVRIDATKVRSISFGGMARFAP